MLLASLGAAPPSEALTVLAKGLFSYEAPPGWFVGPQSNAKFDVAQTGNDASDYAAVLVSIRKSDSSLQDFIEADLRGLPKKQSHILSREPFLTAAGLDGLRVAVAGLMLPGAGNAPTERVLYFFDGGSSQKIIIEATCPQSKADCYVPLFDAAMKSFTLE